MKLIDKEKVIEYILKRKPEIYDEYGGIVTTQRGLVEYKVLQEMQSFLNTLEVKEVDLEESARHYLLHEHISPLNEVLHQADIKVEMQYHKDIEDAYKAGFELGVNARKGE